MKYFLITIIFFMNTIAYAQPSSVYVHLPLTRHFPGVSYKTQNNWGLGLQIDHDVVFGFKPLGGVYYNSNRKISIYAGLQKWIYSPTTYLHFGVGGVLVTGYQPRLPPIVPFPFIYVELWRLRAIVIPGAVNLTFDLLRW